MFKNEYQGGPFVEIFSSQGKDPVAKWKLCGSPAIHKVFDKDVRSYVYVLEGSSQINKMQLPMDSKQTLGLVQRFLLLQLCVPMGQDFSTELLITDLRSIKRRLYLSTIHKELTATPLHAKIPLSIIKRKIWINFCIDLVSFTHEAFNSATFQSLDGIVVTANCKLRKIFTMKLQPNDTTYEDDVITFPCFTDGPTDMIPKSCQLGVDVNQVTQLLNAFILKRMELRIGSQPFSSTDLDQLNSRGTAHVRGIKSQDTSHIAFGTKVPGPPPNSGRKGGAKDISVSLDNRTARASYQSRSGKGAPSDRPLGRFERPTAISQEGTHSTRQTSGNSTSEEHRIVQPRKQQEFAFDENNRRKFGVHSGSEEDTGLINDEDFPDQAEESLPFPEYSPAHLEHSREHFHSELNGSSKENANGSTFVSEDEEEEHQLKQKGVFTYSSCPRSAPHGKVQSTSIKQLPCLENLRSDGDRRGARLEEDFHGSDSNEENDLQIRIVRRPPGAGMSCKNSEAWMLNFGSISNSKKESQSSGSRPSGGTVKSLAEQELKGISTPPLIKAETERFPSSIPPMRSRSPARQKVSDTVTINVAKIKGDQTSQSKASVVKKSLKEIQKEDPRLTSEKSEYNWQNYQPKDMSESDEARMLASLRRQQLEELEDDGKSNQLNAVQLGYCVYGDDSISTSSDDTSIWSTRHTGPPVNQGHHYQNEMLLTLSQKKVNPLLLSNPREWGNIYSPPIILPSEHLKQQKNSLSSGQPSVLQDSRNNTSSDVEDEDEVLDLLYDSCLNCYFDPKTGKYYELA